MFKAIWMSSAGDTATAQIPACSPPCSRRCSRVLRRLAQILQGYFRRKHHSPQLPAKRSAHRVQGSSDVMPKCSSQRPLALETVLQWMSCCM